MSLLPNQTNVNQERYFFLLVDAKVINTSTITANTGTYDKLFVNSISTGSVLVNNISSLTGSISSLTTNSISTGSITSENFTSQNGFISSLFTNSILTSSITAQTGVFTSSLFANSILTSSITAQTGVFTSSISADTGFFSTISTTNLNAGTAFISSINNSTISQFDASRWSFFKAQSTVTAELIPPDPFFPLLFPRKQYDIKDFRDLYIRNVIAEADNTAGGGIYTGNVGNIGIINGAIVNSTERNSVGIANSNGLIEVNGVNKLAGFNALSVTGGVTLSGGGTIHGITLGTQPVGGIDTIRLELLPLLGITLTTPILPITLTSGSAVLITAGGALTLTSGGILSLAGGDRIEYNTDENRFINSSAGNDFTDILVGNIFPAFGGSANLRINGGGTGRGVELANVRSINLDGNVIAPLFDYNTNYPSLFQVEYDSTLFTSLTTSFNNTPSATIPLWEIDVEYYPNTIRTDPTTSESYKCISFDNNNIEPHLSPNWVFFAFNNAGSFIWVPNITPPPIVSYIQGDRRSYINVGAITASTISGSYNINSSTITANTILMKGDNPNIQFYKPDAPDAPEGFITCANDAGMNIVGFSSINILTFGSGLLQATSTLGIIAGFQIALDASFTTINNALFTSTIFTDNINASNVSSFIVNTKELYTDSIGNFNPITPTPILVNNALNFGSNSIFDLDDIRARSLSTNLISTTSVYASEVYTEALGNPLSFGTFPININNTLNFLGNDASNIFRLSASNISTNNLSSGRLFAGLTSTLQLGVSSINANTVRATTVATDRLIGNTGNQANTFTNNLFPTSASAFVGYGPNTAGGGFYSAGHFRSTFTSVIQPDTVAGQLSNVVRVNGILSTNTLTTQFLAGAGPVAGPAIYCATLLPNGGQNIGNAPNNSWGGWFNTINVQTLRANTASGDSINSTIRVLGTLSTQNLMVSTINRKLYPYTSTFGVLNSASTFRFNGTDAVVPQVLYSNITFPHIGTYLVSGKNSLSKASGGTGAEPHGFFSLSRGLYASTFSVEDGFSSLPFMNRNNVSTLNTFSSEIYVSSMNTNTRFITYTDYSAHSYVMNFGLGQLRATYIPRQGLLPE